VIPNIFFLAQEMRLVRVEVILMLNGGLMRYAYKNNHGFIGSVEAWKQNLNGTNKALYYVLEHEMRIKFDLYFENRRNAVLRGKQNGMDYYYSRLLGIVVRYSWVISGKNNPILLVTPREIDIPSNDEISDWKDRQI
jgi:hypothetical protein